MILGYGRGRGSDIPKGLQKYSCKIPQPCPLCEEVQKMNIDGRRQGDRGLRCIANRKYQKRGLTKVGGYDILDMVEDQTPSPHQYIIRR